MQKKHYIAILFGILLFSRAISAFEYKGEFAPFYKFKLSDPSETLSFQYTLGKLDISSYITEEMTIGFSSQLLLEKNDIDLKLTSDLKEIYVDFYTLFCDIRLGRQILSWGMADEQNPMDNLNSLNLADPFQSKSDQKQGILAAKIDTYYAPYIFQLLWLPEFKSHQLPQMATMDFSNVLALPEGLPSSDEINQQYGARLVYQGQGFDTSLSYYDGLDKLFSASPLNRVYLRTRVLGLDFATTYDSWDVRGETAYFMTQDYDSSNALVKNPYIQGVFGLSYFFESQFKVGTTYAREWILGIDSDSEDVAERNLLTPMGVSLFMFTKEAVVAFVDKTFEDWFLQSKLALIYDMTSKGLLIRPELEYVPMDDVKISIGAYLFSGDAASKIGKMDDEDQGYFRITFYF